MKPIRPIRKLQLHRETLRQMTPRQVPPADLARVVGGQSEEEARPSDFCTYRNCCPLMSED